MLRFIIALWLLTTVSWVAQAESYTTSPRVGNCPIFPDDNWWNTDISTYTVHPNSNAYIASINANRQFLHADFGANPDYGIPFVVVGAAQPRVPITFTAYGDESDPGPYPIPANAPVEGGSDRHVIAVDGENCKLYELFNAEYNGTGWNADSGAVFNLLVNDFRRFGWTSADAAGLPIYPGLAAFTACLHLARHPLRLQQPRPQPAADGAAGAPESQLRHQRLHRSCAGDPGSAQTLWHDRGG
jgi:hypothetical protein